MWHVAWAEVAAPLFELMTVYGFRTDTTKLQSVEKLAGRCADAARVDAAMLILPLTTTPATRSLAPIASILHVKGWKRAVAAQVIATILMQEGEAVRAMQHDDPEIFTTFCTAHSVLVNYSNTEDSIYASRALTMQSTSVRQAPNCFNYVHQIKLLLRTTAGDDAGKSMTKWSEKQGAMKAFAIGNVEAQASINLATKVTPQFHDALRELVETWGMRKGPLTNEALALESICVGKGPRFQNSAWQRDCTVDAEILELLAERIKRDWCSTAPSMRRAINGAGMEAKLKLCGGHSKRPGVRSRAP